MRTKKDEIKKRIEEKEKKYKRELTTKEIERIENSVDRKYAVRKKIGIILAALGITAAVGGKAYYLSEGKNNEAENKKEIESTLEDSEATKTDINTQSNSFRENLQTETYSQITEEIAKEYNKKYNTKLSAADIAYIQSNPQFLAIDGKGTYVQDYKESEDYSGYINSGIKDVYVFINKNDDTIISSIGKVENEIQNIDTKIVMAGKERKEYVEADKKIDITKGKNEQEKEEIYKAMEEESKQKSQKTTEENQIENEAR